MNSDCIVDQLQSLNPFNRKDVASYKPESNQQMVVYKVPKSFEDHVGQCPSN